MNAPLIMKWNCWPQADRDAWVSLFQAGDDEFDESGPGCDWADGTRSKFEQTYGHWLAFLARNEELDDRTPAARITGETVRLFAAETGERISGGSTADRVKDLYILATAFDPDRDWTWLKVASGRLSRQHPGELKPRRGVDACGVNAWAEAEMSAALDMPDDGSWERSIRFRDGLMVGLLIARPLRLRTFAAIEIDRHLVIGSTGCWLRFEPDDIKDRKRHEWPFPAHLTEPLQRYLAEFRPALLDGRTSSRLWVSRRGGPLSRDGLHGHFANITVRAFGETLGPHAFRDIAATSIAEEDPEHVAIIADILGHSSLHMAERHYNRATGVKAAVAFQELVRGRRRSSRRAAQSRRDSLRRRNVE